jgi:hypothetical protein
MRKKTHEEFLLEIANYPFTAISTYKTAKERVDLKCDECGHEWSPIGSSASRGHGCPRCAGKCSNDIIEDNGNWLLVDISTRRNKSSFMKIDKCDYELIRSESNARISAVISRGILYAKIKIDGKYTPVHKLILPNSECVDHENRDSLDNRRLNLRSCTQAENTRNRLAGSNNTSGFRGVSRVGKRWRSRINDNCKTIQLGTFDTPEEAFKIRLDAEKKYYGEFAPSNK